jgi:two-component system OmpR family sensor kinase
VLPKTPRPALRGSDDAHRLRELLSAVEHDLRGPLGAIATWTHVLALGECVAREQGLAAIDRSVKSATRLLDDLHDLSRIADHRLPLTHQPVDLWLVLEAAARNAEAIAEGKTIRLPSPVVGAFASGDADRFARILHTLLASAVAGAAAGGVVEVLLHRDDRFWQIEIGEPLREAPPARSSAGRIALLLVRELVELHGGTLSGMDGTAEPMVVVRLPAVEAAENAAARPRRER